MNKNQFRTLVETSLEKLGHEAGGIKVSDIPFSGEWGLATNAAFLIAGKLAKQGGGPFPKLRDEIAEKLAEALRDEGSFLRVEAVNGYVNAFFDTVTHAAELLDAVLNQGEDFGRGEDRPGRAMVEYSQPNTHKSFHIGHLRNVCLGAALIRTLRFSGREVVAANYIGDVGTHIAEFLAEYFKNHDGEKPGADPNRWFGEIYAAAKARAADDAEFKESSRQILRDYEAGDQKIIDTWKTTREASLKAFNEIYEELDAPFDVVFYESDVEDYGKEIVKELLDSGLAEMSEGAPVVRIDEKLGLKKDKYRTLLILKSDGTSLYATKDLALAKKKFEEYDIDFSIYVVGSEQNFYFQQIFQTLGLMGFEQAKNCHHLSYGEVMLPEGKMGSRSGNVVLYHDLMNDVLSSAASEVAEKRQDLSEEERAAITAVVALGAVKYGMLKIDPLKKIVFKKDEAVRFEGDTGPYLQYAHARCCSLLRKAAYAPGPVSIEGDELTRHDLDLVDALGRFPEIVEKAAAEMRPNLVANYLFELAQTLAAFYNACPVIRADSESLKSFRLALVDAVRQVLANGLNLLVIEAPTQM